MSTADWGLTFETHAADQLDLEDVAHDGGEHALVDGYTTRTLHPRTGGSALRPVYRFAERVSHGSAVACKVARYRIRDGESTRRGRWCLYRAELATVDAVALGVYTREGGVLDEATAILPVEAIAECVTSWTRSPHADYGLVTRIPWSRVFDPTEVRDAR